MRRARHLIPVLGDQLSRSLASLDGFDPARDQVLMVEAREEAVSVPQHKQRLVLFLAAMRHHAAALESNGITVRYVRLDDPASRGTLAGEIARAVEETGAGRVVLARPGDHRVLADIEAELAAGATALEVREDRHFLCSVEEFEAFASGRKSLVMETFYRHMRRESGLLMEGGDPAGGRWNFDADNRAALGASGTRRLAPPLRFEPNPVTREVMALVERVFPDSPGSTSGFDHAVTREQALAALDDFVTHRLADFGRYQDAMAAGQPYLYHSLLSAAMNLHLLDPREVVDAAITAWREGLAPLNSVEGFVRQIIGWREFIRGVYWTRMPEYATRNALAATLEVPPALWGAPTRMRCVSESAGQLLAHGYAHHIQRLMILGQLTMLLGCDPYRVHQWHMGLYLDAVDWVSLPNVLGMSQHADGGLVGTKPYCASGNYVSRMSDYCKGCDYAPKRANGEGACPFTALYWDFLARHRERLRSNRRMGFQIANLARKPAGELSGIRRHAQAVRQAIVEGSGDV